MSRGGGGGRADGLERGAPHFDGRIRQVETLWPTVQQDRGLERAVRSPLEAAGRRRRVGGRAPGGRGEQRRRHSRHDHAEHQQQRRPAHAARREGRSESELEWVALGQVPASYWAGQSQLNMTARTRLPKKLPLGEILPHTLRPGNVLREREIRLYLPLCDASGIVIALRGTSSPTAALTRDGFDCPGSQQGLSKGSGGHVQPSSEGNPGLQVWRCDVNTRTTIDEWPRGTAQGSPNPRAEQGG